MRGRDARRGGDIVLNYELEGSGTPLVLTHGLGDDLHFWDSVAPSWQRISAVLRWDVRGFGLSDKPPGPYSAGAASPPTSPRCSTRSASTSVHIARPVDGRRDRAALRARSSRLALRSLVLVSTSSEVGPRGTANWQRLADTIEQRGFGAGARDASRAFSPALRRRAIRTSSPRPASRRRATSRPPTPPRRGR